MALPINIEDLLGGLVVEGRGTGFPTINEELRKNGSPDTIIEADDNHTYFIIRNHRGPSPVILLCVYRGQ